MKNTVLCLSALFLISPANADAQTHPLIGFKAGLSIPNLTSGSSSNPVSSGYGSRLDLDAAIHVEFPLCERFSIQPQLEYSSQGGQKNGTQAFTVPADMQALFPPEQIPAYLYADYKSVAKINYLMLPVVLKYRIHRKKDWSAYIAGGPFLGYLLNAKNITTGSSIIYLDEQKTLPIAAQSQSFNQKENITPDLHRFNTGISGHLGTDMILGSGSVFIEIGGNYGLIDIQKGSSNGKNKTGAASIDLGYQFHF